MVEYELMNMNWWIWIDDCEWMNMNECINEYELMNEYEWIWMNA